MNTKIFNKTIWLLSWLAIWPNFSFGDDEKPRYRHQFKIAVELMVPVPTGVIKISAVDDAPLYGMLEFVKDGSDGAITASVTCDAFTIIEAIDKGYPAFANRPKLAQLKRQLGWNASMFKQRKYVLRFLVPQTSESMGVSPWLTHSLIDRIAAHRLKVEVSAVLNLPFGPKASGNLKVLDFFFTTTFPASDVNPPSRQSLMSAVNAWDYLLGHAEKYSPSCGNIFEDRGFFGFVDRATAIVPPVEGSS